jgi:hypothetical protein
VSTRLGNDRAGTEAIAAETDDDIGLVDLLSHLGEVPGFGACTGDKHESAKQAAGRDKPEIGFHGGFPML